MEKLNVGIIGLGAVGERLLKQFTEHPLSRVVAVSDVNTARMEEVQSRMPDAAAFTDYRNMLSSEAVNLIYVAVPPKLHHKMVLDAFAANKHVLCEKPLANSLQEARYMMDAAASAGVVNAIHFPLPYSGPVHELQRRLEAGFIGKVKRIEQKMHFPAWPRAWQQNPWIAGREQGGFIREISPHYIQLIHQLFGRTKKVNSYIDFPEDPSACETGILARMELQDGTPVLINGLSGVAKEEEIAFTVYGDKGVLSLKNWSVLTGRTLDGEEVLLERETGRDGIIDELAKAVSGKEAKLVTFQEGFAVQETLEKLLNRG
ncbi:MAG TPA: Gfo/Idh/MocA family oxidoreductase [Bacillaceae bacterium]